MCPVGMDRSAPRGRVVGRMQYAPTWYLAKFAGVRRRPYAIRPYMYPAKFAGVRRRPRPNLADIPDAFSALLSDSIFAAVFGDAS